MAHTFRFLYFFLWLLLVACSSAKEDMGSITIQSGPVAGTASADGKVHIFKGIPYAAPPVGELRWKAPQPVEAWTEERACQAFGPSPMQRKPAPFSMWTEEFLIPEEPISEDCLYLNVWTNAESSKDKLPVVVWIYGGGFVSGGSAVPIYDGEAMARKGIVFVSINYRVGIFGFFAHPELTKESPHQASGNYGLMDQIAALQWVQQNIAAFGGDPAQVTIAGQSAGAMSVNCLVASPLTQGLFKQAIAESGASFTRSNISLQEAEEEGMRTMRACKVDSLAELRKLPADELLQKAGGTRPVIDGYVLPEAIIDIFQAGRQQDVALLTGWNEDEGLSYDAVKSAAAYRQQIQEQYGAKAQPLLQQYPAADDTQAARSQIALSRDMIFGVQNYTWANLQSRQNKAVYVYRFTRKVPAMGEYVKYGAFHTGEVAYAYDNLKFIRRPWEETDQQLAQIMSSYWANFIASGNPNGSNLPEWPAYRHENPEVMQLGDTVKATALPGKAALDVLYTTLQP